VLFCFVCCHCLWCELSACLVDCVVVCRGKFVNNEIVESAFSWLIDSSFLQSFREAKYEKCVHSWWKKNVVLNGVSLKNILYFCNSVFPT
jgi:hypothetical protein